MATKKTKRAKHPGLDALYRGATETARAHGVYVFRIPANAKGAATRTKGMRVVYYKPGVYVVCHAACAEQMQRDGYEIARLTDL